MMGSMQRLRAILELGLYHVCAQKATLFESVAILNAVICGGCTRMYVLLPFSVKQSNPIDSITNSKPILAASVKNVLYHD